MSTKKIASFLTISVIALTSSKVIADVNSAGKDEHMKGNHKNKIEKVEKWLDASPEERAKMKAKHHEKMTKLKESNPEKYEKVKKRHDKWQERKRELENLSPEERREKLKKYKEEAKERKAKRKEKFDKKWQNSTDEQKAEFCAKVTEKCASGKKMACEIKASKC